MKRLLTIFTLTVFLAILTGTASAVTISGSDFNNNALVGSVNGTYVAGSPGYMHLAYANGTDAVVGAKGPFGTLTGLSMSFDYSNMSPVTSSPYAAFGVSEDSLWNSSAQKFQIIAMTGTEINSGTLVHVFNTNTNTNYIPMSGAITLGQLLGLSYNGFAFGDMNVLRAYAYIGDWPGVTAASVNINSITVTSSVPEPATMLLLGLGLMGLAGIRRKFKS